MRASVTGGGFCGWRRNWKFAGAALDRQHEAR